MKRKPVEFDDAAQAELNEAIDWYLERSVAAALRLRATLDTVIDLIRQFPKIGPKIRPRSRFFRLRKFPYLLIYRELKSTIRIVAFAHASREHGYWQDRLS